MHQHERPAGRPHAHAHPPGYPHAHPFRRPRPRPALATAAVAAPTGALHTATAGTATAPDPAHAPRADFDQPSGGTKITTTGSRTVSPSTSGVSTTGRPNVGANLAY